MSPYRRGDRFYVEFTDETGRRRRSSSKARTMKEAALLEAELRVSADRAKKGLAHGSLNPERLTLSEAAKKYLAKMRGRASHANLVHTVAKHVDRSGLGDLLLEHVTSRRIDAYLDEATKTPGTANRVRSCFSAIFRTVKKQKLYFGDNPVADVDQREEPDQTEDEIPAERVIELLDEAPDADWHLVFAFAAYCGLRRGEIEALDLERDINLRTRILVVRKSKTNVVRRVGVHRDLVPLIQAAKKRGLKMDSRTWQKSARMVKGILEDEAPTFHDLRSTWASRLVDCGADEHVVDFMGWGKKKSSTFRSRYLEYPDARLVAEVDKLIWPKPVEDTAQIRHKASERAS